MSGYSGTPLVKKLGLKAGMRVRLLDAPEGYWEILSHDAEELGVTVVPADGGPVEFTHLFATEPDPLRAAFRRARAGMVPDGMTWASWPKKASGVASEIGRDEVFAAGHEAGLVDVKVCAVDETWSGVKFVVPVADRSG